MTIQNTQRHYSCYFCIPSKPTNTLLFSMQENCSGKKHNQLTSSMTPFRMSLDSTPTLRSSRHSLSNFSGVSLFSMLKRNKSKKHRIYRYCKHAMSHFRPNLTFYFLHLLKIEKCNFPFNCSYFFSLFEILKLRSIIENTYLLTRSTLSVFCC